MDAAATWAGVGGGVVACDGGVCAAGAGGVEGEFVRLLGDGVRCGDGVRTAGAGCADGARRTEGGEVVLARWVWGS